MRKAFGIGQHCKPSSVITAMLCFSQRSGAFRQRSMTRAFSNQDVEVDESLLMTVAPWSAAFGMSDSDGVMTYIHQTRRTSDCSIRRMLFCSRQWLYTGSDHVPGSDTKSYQLMGRR